MARFVIRAASGSVVSRSVDKDTVSVGSSAENDLVLEDPRVTGHHAEIRRQQDDWLLVDLASRHGTLLNGQRVRGLAGLHPGDEIAFGDTTVEFKGLEAAPAERARAAPRGFRASAALSTSVEPPAVLVGASRAIAAVQAMIERVAPSTATVLIQGESGTGKEIVAGLVHQRSQRSSGPFVIVNCPALPGSLMEYELFGVETRVATGVDARPGRLEMAHGGTVLLDEVADLDPAAQAKLLRFIQDKKVERIGGRRLLPLDIRILAATNQDLGRAVERGAFRNDLHHRLNTLTIHLPPLRERREDIPALVEHFLARAGGPTITMSPEALEQLALHRFPGNVRELERIVERARLLCDGQVIRPCDIPRCGNQGSSADALGAQRSEDAAAELYDRIVNGGTSFWAAVHEPFLRRTLSAEVVRRLIERCYGEGHQSNRQMAHLLRLDDVREYKKLTAFLRNHGLLIRKSVPRGRA